MFLCIGYGFGLVCALGMWWDVGCALGVCVLFIIRQACKVQKHQVPLETGDPGSKPWPLASQVNLGKTSGAEAPIPWAPDAKN